ncbi:hypothetical protein ACYZT4_05465 [Pseudomonas sp. GB2N2]
MARKVTRKEYLEWAALEPRTNKWDAYASYNKVKCNQLLLQEYIWGFDTDKYMLPFSGAYMTGETTYTAVVDLQTDVPRLSFENYPDENGAVVAEANMTMATLGGLEVDLAIDTTGQASVTSIRSNDPLDYPDLKAEKVLLKDIQGVVGKNSQVILDLGDFQSQRNNWEYSNSRIQHVRRMGGNFFKRKFREAAPERRTYVLGELAPSEQLKPGKFKLRTVMEDGANVRSAPNYSEGALEVRIAMEGSLEGGTPGEDWLYPLNTDFPQDDALLMFSNLLVLRHIIGKTISQQFSQGQGSFEAILTANGFSKFAANADFDNGHVLIPSIRVDLSDWDGGGTPVGSVEVLPFEINVYNNAIERLVVEMSDDSILLRWAFKKDKLPAETTTAAGQPILDLTLELEFTSRHTVSVHPDTRKLVVSDGQVDIVRRSLTFVGDHPYADDAIKFLEHKDRMYKKFEAIVKDKVSTLFKFDDIDAFVINSILFNSGDAVQLRNAFVPGDIVAWGAISPRMTTFSIDPLELLLAPGAVHQFNTLPPTQVKWSVSTLDGTPGDAGQIDENTGRYTAPSLGPSDGAFKRVKIAATGGGSDGKAHVSKALVTVPRRAVSLNPRVTTCPASGDQPQTREFSAGAINGSLKWSVTGNGSIPETANPDRTNLYKAPPRDPQLVEKSFTIELVNVVNPTTQQKDVATVVVTHGSQTVKVSANFDGLPEGQAQYSATFNNKPAPEAVWKCIPESAGNIDQSGFFIAGADKSHEFAIITVTSSISDFDLWLGDAFYIQPLPLGPLPSIPDPVLPLGADGMPQV